MEPCASTFVYRHTRLGILTEQPAELVDLTAGLDALLHDASVSRGFLNVQSLQTGTGIRVTAQPSSAPPGRENLTSAACLPIANGRLQLEAAQRVFLVELDGPGAREIAVVMVGEARR